MSARPRPLGAARRVTKFQRILNRLSLKQYHYRPTPRYAPVWTGRKRVTFGGAKPASDLLNRPLSLPARFVRRMRAPSV